MPPPKSFCFGSGRYRNCPHIHDQVYHRLTWQATLFFSMHEWLMVMVNDDYDDDDDDGDGDGDGDGDHDSWYWFWTEIPSQNAEVSFYYFLLSENMSISRTVATLFSLFAGDLPSIRTVLKHSHNWWCAVVVFRWLLGSGERLLYHVQLELSIDDMVSR